MNRSVRGGTAYGMMKNKKKTKSMKRIHTICLLLALTLAAAAQDFKLYFSNNVTDVTDFSQIETAEGLATR